MKRSRSRFTQQGIICTIAVIAIIVQAGGPAWQIIAFIGVSLSLANIAQLIAKGGQHG